MSHDDASQSLLTFDQVANQMVEENVTVVSPSELHGYYCGLLSTSTRLPALSLLESTREMLDVEKYQSHASKMLFITLYEQSLNLLQASDFSFALMLPDDDEELEVRTRALGEWCQGFLTGFGLGGKQSQDNLNPDIREALTDLSHIAQATVGEEFDDGSESDFYEVQEYVRMVALAAFTEYNEPPEEESPQTPRPTLH